MEASPFFEDYRLAAICFDNLHLAAHQIAHVMLEDAQKNYDSSEQANPTASICLEPGEDGVLVGFLVLVVVVNSA